jgi:2-aminoethylphosphonate aminotransferase
VVAIVGGEADYTCVPLQGSGTFSVEAAIGTLVPPDGKVLVPNNGAYCARIVRICTYLKRAVVDLPVPEDRPATAAVVEAALAADPSITHVAQVHCETGAGVLNDLAGIAAVCKRMGKGLIVDAMSSFAALPIDVRTTPFDALIAASGKCLEGVPGMGFVIVRTALLEKCAGNSHSLAMDLHDQYIYMEKTTQWRYTPPTHVVAALRTAIDQFQEEGGQPARLARYESNCKTLVDGMAALGFRPFLDLRCRRPSSSPSMHPPILPTTSRRFTRRRASAVTSCIRANSRKSRHFASAASVPSTPTRCATSCRPSPRRCASWESGRSRRGARRRGLNLWTIAPKQLLGDLQRDDPAVRRPPRRPSAAGSDVPSAAVPRSTWQTAPTFRAATRPSATGAFVIAHTEMA